MLFLFTASDIDNMTCPLKKNEKKISIFEKVFSITDYFLQLKRSCLYSNIWNYFIQSSIFFLQKGHAEVLSKETMVDDIRKKGQDLMKRKRGVPGIDMVQQQLVDLGKYSFHFESLALHCCGFESRLWIPSCDEAIQLAYEVSVVLLSYPLVPEIMHQRSSSTSKAGKLPCNLYHLDLALSSSARG